MAHPQERYQNRVTKYQEKVRELEKKSRWVSHLRLLTSLGGMGTGIYFYLHHLYPVVAGIFLITIFIFLRLVIHHQSLRNKKNFAQAMLEINKQSLARLSDAWTQFPDTGTEFLQETHPFAVDLDIFGKRSLFQLINTTNTFLGRKRLKNLLLSPFTDIDQVLIRQKNIRDLADSLDFRQKFQSEGSLLTNKDQNPEDLFRWTKNFQASWTSPYVKVLTTVSPLVLVILTVLAFILPDRIPFFLPLTQFLCHGIILFYFSKNTGTAFTVADKYQKNIKGYKRMLQLFEEEEFQAPGLKKLQKELKIKKNQPAFQQIKRLGKAVDMSYLRYHQLYFIFNLFTLWDFHVMAALEGWKKKFGYHLEEWLHTLGEIEALSSLALLAFDHPNWCFPQFYESSVGISAKDLGHPLLPETRVCNDIEIKNAGEILLITGSNMSGKSTFLRTVGINLLLAYLGAPVCAREFKCSFLHIYTSMRINDNLDTGTSSFFAELLRIKTILAEAKGGKPIIFLLDEIFRGTNSRDRHTGAKHLIKKLSDTGAVGLVSTHDLELGDLAKESPWIKNYHFDEYYQNGKIFFDYKLKPGVSTTRNAIFLMKMAGIDINE
ncbi:MAG: MutS-related protein [Bacillota bacterium]|nr:DNA mismatch repair protein [Clostridia bacterium]